MIAAVPVPPGDRPTSPSASTVTDSQVGALVPRRRREDRAGTILLGAGARMYPGLHRVDRVGDLHARAAQLGHAGDVDRQPDRFAVDDRVEPAAKGDVGAHQASGGLDRQAALRTNDGTPVTVTRSTRSGVPARARPHRARRPCRTRSTCHRRPASAGRARARWSSTAMMPWPDSVRIALVVHEQHAGVRPGATGSVSSAPHMSAWPRGSSISARRRWSACRPTHSRFLDHRASARRGKSVDDEPQRSAGGVRVDCLQRHH